jgi:hypothetical protein
MEVVVETRDRVKACQVAEAASIHPRLGTAHCSSVGRCLRFCLGRDTSFAYIQFRSVNRTAVAFVGLPGQGSDGSKGSTRPVSRKGLF